MAHKVAIINGKEPNAGNGGVSDADLSYIAINFFTAGVLSSTGYQVQQQVTPDMTVKVKAGKALVFNATGSNAWLTNLDADANVTIGANVAGNPRIDALVIKIDLSADPDENASNVATLVAVQGAAAASPSAPNDAAIQSAVGAGNAFLRLGNVTVANGAVSITTANISDARTRVKAKFGETPLKFPDADGTTGQAIKTDGAGNLSFGDVSSSASAARVYNTVNISIPHNTMTALTFNSERYDTDTMHDLVTNPGRLTCKTAGKYEIGAGMVLGASGTGRRYAELRLNGTTVIDIFQIPVNSASAGTILKLNTQYDLAVNDYVEVRVLQDSGGALNVEASGNYSPEFWMARVG
jgi:hypothetical protein